MKIKNEKVLKKNIQDRLNELHACESEIENAKHELRKCREKVSESKNELHSIDQEKYTFVEVEDSEEAIKYADKKTARVEELNKIITFSENRIETFGSLERDYEMKLTGLKEPLTIARSEYCQAFESAVKATPEWKSAYENICLIKAFWFECFQGNIYFEDVIGDLGLHEIPNDNLKNRARSELFIK